jgi:hypothetical protein
MKKLLLFLIMCSTTLVSAQSVPSYIPTNGLIGFWGFDNNLADSSTYGNDLFGTSYSFTTDRNQTPLSAIQISSKTGSVYVSDSVFNPNIFTISAWVKVTSSWNYTTFNILSMGTSTIGDGVRLLYNHTGSYYEVLGQLGYGSTQTTSNVRETIVPSFTNWLHVAFTNDGNQQNLYIDGALVETGNNTSNISFTNTLLSIGSHANSNNGTLPNRQMDDVAIWNYAMDSIQIGNIFNEVIICNDSISTNPNSATFQTVPGTAHFVTSHSDSSATYQWQQNNGTGWTNLSDFGIYSGTTTDSLVLTGITTTLNGYGYRCIIDACTMDTTDVAFLTVVDNIGIEESAKSLTVSPNPTSGLIYVDIKANYSVYSMTGQKVAEGKTEGQIDISNLPTGSYQLILSTEEGTTTHTIQKI